MVTSTQIQVKLVNLTHQKHSLVYEKQLHEQKIERIKASIECINGAVSVYTDWANDLTDQLKEKEVKKEKIEEKK